MQRMTMWLAVVALIVASPLAAQTPSTQNLATPGATFATGQVFLVTDNAITIEEADGSHRTFMIDEGTVGPDSLAKGTWVQIDYAFDEETGQDMAQTIMGLPEGEAPAAAETAEAGAAEETVTSPGDQMVTAEEDPIEAEPAGVETEMAEGPAGPAYGEETGTGFGDEEGRMAAAAGEDDEYLPATASALPLAGLAGLLALMGAMAIGVASRAGRK